MKPYCETVSKLLLPTLRALIAKELMEKHKMTQQDAAIKLGVTQSAISQYRRALRGSQIKTIEKDEELIKEIENISKKIALDELNPLEALNDLCNICRKVRKSKALCNIHTKVFPELENCTICLK